MMAALREPVRQAPAGHVPLPTLNMSDWSRAHRWWKPEAGIPRRCPICTAHLMVDPPLWDRSGRVWYALGCSREYAYVSSVGWQL